MFILVSAFHSIQKVRCNILSLSFSLSLSHSISLSHSLSLSLAVLSLTNSPCGKKFRSKPQIARFLGETADLGCFDFSRAGTPGDGSQRRRARDRSAKKTIEQISKHVPTVRPLTNNPLRPSGPIRRTCGVIKLPVIWVAPPTDDDLKNDVMSAPLSLPAHPVGQAKPLEASKPPQQMATLVAPVGSGTAELVVPAMWENRLVGVKPCNHETGMEIVVTVNKPQNGLSISGAGALSTAAEGLNGGAELNSNVIQNSPTLQNLIRQQQQQQQKKTATLMATLTQAAQAHSVSQSNGTSQQPGLIQSSKLPQQQQKHLVSSSTAAILSQSGGVVLTSASLANLLRQQQQQHLQRQQQQASTGLTVTSGRAITTSINSTALGSISSVGMAATGNGRLHLQEGSGGGKVGEHVRHVGASGGQSSHISNNIKLSLTGGAASSTNPFVSSTLSVANGPSSMDIDAGEDVEGSKFVSDSEIKLQEEKVRQLRQQLLAAAQAAAKGSAVV